MSIWLLFLTSSVLSTLPTSDLGPFFTSTTVNSFLSSLAAQNSSTLTLTTTDNLKYITLNTGVNPDYYINTVLFLGSMHGGFPLSTYTVLYYLDQLVNYYYSDAYYGYLVDNTQFIFIPILNYAAYNKTQQIYNSTGSFTPIWTGLEGSSWGCPNTSYAGINPDSNFPVNFVQGSDKCASLGFAGNSSLISKITLEIANIFNSTSPSLVFNFDNEGDSIFYPFAANNQNVSDTQQIYYSSIFDVVASQYNYESYFNYSSKSGSLIDYAYSQGSLIFEVWGDNQTTVTTNNVSDSAGALLDFIINAVGNQVVDVLQEDGVLSDVTCDSDCKSIYTKNLTYVMGVRTSNYSPYMCDIIITPNFTSPNITLLSLIGFYQQYNGTVIPRELIECSITGRDVSCSQVVVPGFTMLGINVTYGVPDGVDGDNDFSADFSASTGYYFFYDIVYTSDNFTEVDYGGSSEGGDNEWKGVITGALLLALLIISLAIAAIVLFYVRRKRDSEFPRFESANVA